MKAQSNRTSSRKPSSSFNRYRRFNEIITLLLRFIFIFGIVCGAIYALTIVGLMQAWSMLLARQAGFFLSLVGVQNTVSDINVVLQDRIFLIALECTAVLVMAAYSVLILVYPFSIRLKMLALLAGIPVIYSANLFRLVSLGVVSGLVSDKTFDIVHDILFQMFMVLVVLFLWALCLCFEKTVDFSMGMVVFYGTTLVTTIILEYFFISMGSLAPSVLNQSVTSIIAPVCALIICARGVFWREKLVWLLCGLLGYLTVMTCCAAFGLPSNIWIEERPIYQSLVVGAGYSGIIFGIPIGLALAFVGKRPQRLWLTPAELKSTALIRGK